MSLKDRCAQRVMYRSLRSTFLAAAYEMVEISCHLKRDIQLCAIQENVAGIEEKMQSLGIFLASFLQHIRPQHSVCAVKI